jgi:hypothetical protein
MWPSAILHPDPSQAIAVPQSIDSKPFTMNTAGGVEQERDNGIRILSLGMHSLFYELLAPTLTVQMKIMVVLEPTPSS